MLGIQITETLIRHEVMKRIRLKERMVSPLTPICATLTQSGSNASTSHFSGVRRRSLISHAGARRRVWRVLEGPQGVEEPS